MISIIIDGHQIHCIVAPTVIGQRVLHGVNMIILGDLLGDFILLVNRIHGNTTDMYTKYQRMKTSVNLQLAEQVNFYQRTHLSTID